MNVSFNQKDVAPVVLSGNAKVSRSGTFKKFRRKNRNYNGCKTDGLVDVPVSEESLKYANGSSFMKVKDENNFGFATEGLTEEGCGGWPKSATRGP